MSEKNFYPIDFHFYGLGFFVIMPSGEMRQMYANFFYAHHGGAIKHINKEIVKRSLRPMKRSELGAFFLCNEPSLSDLDSPDFLATADEDIRVYEKDQSKSLIPGIWKKKNGKITLGNLLVSRWPDGEVYISDHKWVVLAIDESRTSIKKKKK